MADEDKKLMNVDTQIFHELGKLSADQQALIREMSGIRQDVKERTDAIVRKVDNHSVDDTVRFDKVDIKLDKFGDRIKPLENWKLMTLWYVLGLAGAVTAAAWVWDVLR